MQFPGPVYIIQLIYICNHVDLTFEKNEEKKCSFFKKKIATLKIRICSGKLQVF